MSLRIERITALGDNYNYLLICEATGEAAIVDPAEVDPVVDRIESCGVRLTKILNTHHHYDHTGGNEGLAKRYDVPVYAHASDAERIPGFSHPLEEGDVVHVGERAARVLFIPSHTLGHIAYVFDEDKALFSGDMLFAAGCGRMFEGNAQMMYEALCEKLSALPDDMRVYCGHEYTQSNLEFAVTVEPDNTAIAEKLKAVREIRARKASDWHDATPGEMTVPSTIGEEKATNPFVRAPSAEELGRIRALKDNF